MPKGVHNGVTVLEPERSLIIERLAAGETCDAIARKLKRHAHTIRAVKETEWQRVEARKPILAAQSERLASVAAEQLLEAVSNRQIKPAQLIPVYGVAVDKSLALRGDPGLVISHQHAHIHAHISESSYSDLLNSLPSKSHAIDAIPIDAQTVSTHPAATQKEQG